MVFMTDLRTTPAWIRGALRMAPLCLLFVVSACGNGQDTDTELDTLATDIPAATAETSQTIYDLLQDEGRFSQLVAAVDSAELEATLAGPGPFTVFAPTNDAFRSAQQEIDTLVASADRDDLRGLLLYHVASGETTAEALRDGAIVRTLEGSDLNVSGSGDSLRVQNARVTESNLDAGNGIIHVIDSILRPESGDDSI